MNTQANQPRIAVRTAKQNLEAVEAAHAIICAKFERDPRTHSQELWASIDKVVKAEEAYHDAYDSAYPMPAIEITSRHVIIRDLQPGILLEAARIVKEQRAAGNVKFSRVFRGKAKREVDVENFLDSVLNK